MWNLKPMNSMTINGIKYEGAVIHQAMHGNSRILVLNGFQRSYLRLVTTPSWFKLGATSRFGHSSNLIRNK